MSDVRYLRKLTDGVPVVETPAEIDITTADQLRLVLLAAASAGPPMVVVDMTRTMFCDASGLHTLLRAHGAVSRVVRLTCLDHLISCFFRLAGALAWTPAAAQHS